MFLVLFFSVFISDIGVKLSHAQNTFRPNQPPIFLPNGDLTKFSIPEDTPVGSVVYRYTKWNAERNANVQNSLRCSCLKYMYLVHKFAIQN